MLSDHDRYYTFCDSSVQIQNGKHNSPQPYNNGAYPIII